MPVVDRLPLFKALAEESRYALFVELSRARASLSAVELAERLDLHPNTVRLHLDRLREVGLVECSASSHGGVGRPQHRWVVAASAPALGIEPGGFRVLAHLLAEAVATGAPDPGALRETGRRTGRARAAASEPADGRAPRASCLRRVLDELADLGFEPVVEDDSGAGATVVGFASCPFRELAALFPDLVCTLHRGLTEGIVEAVGSATGVEAELSGFATLVDPDPCRAELAVGRRPVP